jgi:hypothetical protein
VPGDIPSTQVDCTDRLLRFIYPNKDVTQIAAMMEKGGDNYKNKRAPLPCAFASENISSFADDLIDHDEKKELLDAKVKYDKHVAALKALSLKAKTKSKGRCACAPKTKMR